MEWTPAALPALGPALGMLPPGGHGGAGNAAETVFGLFPVWAAGAVLLILLFSRAGGREQQPAPPPGPETPAESVISRGEDEAACRWPLENREERETPSGMLVFFSIIASFIPACLLGGFLAPQKGGATGNVIAAVQYMAVCWPICGTLLFLYLRHREAEKRSRNAAGGSPAGEGPDVPPSAEEYG